MIEILESISLFLFLFFFFFITNQTLCQFAITYQDPFVLDSTGLSTPSAAPTSPLLLLLIGYNKPAPPTAKGSAPQFSLSMKRRNN